MELTPEQLTAPREQWEALVGNLPPEERRIASHQRLDALARPDATPQERAGAHKRLDEALDTKLEQDKRTAATRQNFEEARNRAIRAVLPWVVVPVAIVVVLYAILR